LKNNIKDKFEHFKDLMTKNPELNERYNKLLIEQKYIREDEKDVIIFVSFNS